MLCSAPSCTAFFFSFYRIVSSVAISPQAVWMCNSALLSRWCSCLSLCLHLHQSTDKLCGGAARAQTWPSGIELPESRRTRKLGKDHLQISTASILQLRPSHTAFFLCSFKFFLSSFLVKSLDWPSENKEDWKSCAQCIKIFSLEEKSQGTCTWSECLLGTFCWFKFLFCLWVCRRLTSCLCCQGSVDLSVLCLPLF